MNNEETLSEALQTFEAVLETPIVPGELPTWAAHACKACREAVATITEHIPVWHKPVLEQIDRQDPELAKRVEKLREEDAALLQQAQRLGDVASRLVADASVLKSHDPAIQQEVRKLTDVGLDWIIRVRKQEAALTTWYQESFNRDRGVAD